MKKLINEISSNRFALIALTEANLKTSVATTRLGWLWWIINPLVMMGIYYFFVVIVLQSGQDNYHLFVLIGIVSWTYFNSALIGATNVIVNNQQLIKQVALPIPMLVMIPVLVQMIFAAIGIILIMIWNFQAIGLHSLLAVPLVVLTGMASYGFGLFISVINVYFADTTQIMNYILRIGFFLSPVLFPMDRITNNANLPDFLKFLFQLNPMAEIMPSLRTVLLDGKCINFTDTLILTGCLMVLMQLGLFWVRRNSSQIVKML